MTNLTMRFFEKFQNFFSPILLFFDSRRNVMDFTQCGWLGTGRYEFSGYTLDPQGKWGERLKGNSLGL